jgi:hypothetical protein
VELFEWSKALNCAKPGEKVEFQEAEAQVPWQSQVREKFGAGARQKKWAGAKLAGLNFVPVPMAEQDTF